MKMFLRYNSRHRVWFPRGYKGCWLPQLNPIESSSHGKNRKRTFGFHEPIWAWRLRQRLFCHAGKTTCDGHPATWDLGPDNNRTCSYCGSIHPDDLMKICRKTLADDRYAVEGTTKSYKVYVRQPGVRNASEGAIKFYMNHVPENVGAADQKLFADAMLISAKRWDAQFQRSRQAVAAE
jgi:uncharacterized Zn-finger protein